MKLTYRVALVSVASVGLAVAGWVSMGASLQSTPKSHSEALLSSPTLHRFGVNAKGETFGEALGIENPAQLPDLIKVRATDGVLGYVTKTAFLGPSPTLQQVLGYPKNAHGNLVGPAQTVPVYAINGTTQVGTFQIGGSTSTTTSSNPMP